MEYTPGQVWSILYDGSDEVEELIDVQVGLTRLPLSERTFLVLLSAGYSARVAMQQSGLKGNQTRLRREALLHLTNVINGI